jgi:hypothetical protein
MPRFLCDPAKAVLDAMVARGDSFTMPTVEFEAPLYEPNIGAPGDQVLRQVVIKGATVEVTGVHHPALVFTGSTLAGPLPHWVFPASDEQLLGIVALVHDMAHLAIRRAGATNGGGLSHGTDE